MPNCRLTKTKFTGCSLMVENIHPEPNARVAGLSLLVATDLDTLKRVGRGVLYRAAAKDAGRFLRYCPWCGKDITPLFMQEDKKGKRPCPTAG